MVEASLFREKRMEYQDAEGIEAEVLNPTWGLKVLQDRDRDLVRACAEVYNDWLADFCSYNPKRLIGTPMIPIEDVDWAVKELERVTKKGLQGAFISLEPPEGFPTYRDETYDPFWATAQELGVPVTLHVATGRSRSPLRLHTPEEIAEAPTVIIHARVEVMCVLANDFIYGGVLDRFPDLKLLCSEFEISWVPWLMFVMDRNMQTTAVGLGIKAPQMMPSDYMRNRVWHGFIEDPYARHVTPLIGTDRVLWGSDFPHPEGIGLGVQKRLGELLEGLLPEQQNQMLATNALRVWDF
jgi:predicted TIM-barrel fold metal-dependent hydrolase